jgi:uncharacterized protein (DUF433 family)
MQRTFGVDVLACTVAVDWITHERSPDRRRLRRAWGRACVCGTRLSVEFLQELATSGAPQAEILRQYPQLTPEGLAAAFQYAARALKGNRPGS